MRKMEEHYLKSLFLINSHTHIGDAFINLPEKNYSVEELVAPVYGYKHRMLEKASKEKIINGMKKAIDLMEKVGTNAFVDFREGGIERINLLKKALDGRRIKAIILGRPKEMKYDENEVDSILSISHGIGLSSISDWNEDIEKIAEHVHKKKKIFALHVSEAKRENIDEVLKLEPSFVVHLCMASEKDIEKVAEEGVPIVVCPRSNAFFGLRPKIELLMKYNATIMLGTDNAMIVEPDIVEELKYTIKNFEIDEKEAIKMVSSNPKKVFKEFLI